MKTSWVSIYWWISEGLIARLWMTWTLCGTLIDAAQGAGATIVASPFHKFASIGVYGVVVIAESYLSIHASSELGAVRVGHRDVARGRRIFIGGNESPAQAEERVSPAQVGPAGF